MSLLKELSNPEIWEQFYAYKTSLACPKDVKRQLRGFLDERGYLSVCDEIQAVVKAPLENHFPLPRRSVISKQSSQKKRIVYTYPQAENTVLKLLTYLMLRKYDSLFSDGLYSFRPNRSANGAVRDLMKIQNLHLKYSYKVDVSNYFNSIPVERLLPKLEEVLREDPELFTFLKSLLTEPCVALRESNWAKAPDSSSEDANVKEQAKTITEDKGIMAGTPLASFYANLYLRDMDQWFYDHEIPYARYSDDIIVFGDTEEEVRKYGEKIRTLLLEHGLSVNPKKEELRRPEEGFVFLGFYLNHDVIDVAPASIMKMKKKMRRKARSLMRWKDQNNLPGEKAAKAFIRVFNRKLLESSMDSDLTWSYWYFSTINTTDSLRVIDHYCQECIRYLLTGTHTKARFNAKYEDFKGLGYQSLVHAYYSFTDTSK